MTKPLVATVIALGVARSPRFNGTNSVLWGQTRGYYNPSNGQLLKGSPGERSIFGEHVKEGVDASSHHAAVRCAHQEFWYKGGLTLDDFKPLAQGVETAASVNDVFLFKRIAYHDDMDIGDGDGLLRIPLEQVSWYICDGYLTEASIATLNAVPPLEELWKMIA